MVSTVIMIAIFICDVNSLKDESKMKYFVVRTCLNTVRNVCG